MTITIFWEKLLDTSESPKVNIQYIKKFSKITILNLIREKNKLSRAEAVVFGGSIIHAGVALLDQIHQFV